MQSTSTPDATTPDSSPGIKGNYAGLFADTNVTPDSSGYCAVTATASAKFSGKLVLGSKRYGFHGRFDPGGGYDAQHFARHPGPADGDVAHHLTNGTDQITGQVTGSNLPAVLLCDRNVFNARSNPAAQAGLRLFRLDRASDNTVADAAGSSPNLPRRRREHSRQAERQTVLRPAAPWRKPGTVR